MADLHEPNSRTSFDAMMGDLMAVGLYGDPVGENFENSSLRDQDLPASDTWHVSPTHQLFRAAWFVAIFVISAAISPYILN